MFYLFVFINTLILISILNAFFHMIWNIYTFDKDFTTRHSTGRIVDFKTGLSKTQYGPVKSL